MDMCCHAWVWFMSAGNRAITCEKVILCGIFNGFTAKFSGLERYLPFVCHIFIQCQMFFN